jgi:hypothetical protein
MPYLEGPMGWGEWGCEGVWAGPCGNVVAHCCGGDGGRAPRGAREAVATRPPVAVWRAVA